MSDAAALPQSHRLSLTVAEAALVAAGNRKARIEPQGTEDPYNDPRNRVGARETLISTWPGLADLAHRISALLERSPHAVLLSHVPVESPEPFFVALTASLGDIVEPYRQSWSRSVTHIRPQTDVVVKGPGVLNQHLHTDGTHWPRSNDLTCLLCLSADQNDGGRSRLLPYDSLVDALKNTQPAVWQTLSTVALPWQLDKELGGGIYVAPVFGDDGVRWLKHTIDQAVEAGVDITQEVADALRSLEEFVEVCPGVHEFPLSAGDLLIVDNKRCLHARTPIPDPSHSLRHLARIKVNR